MAKGGGSSETTTKVEPWGPSQPYLEGLLPLAQHAFYGNKLNPKTFQEATGQSAIAGPGRLTLGAEQSMAQQAMRDMRHGNPLLQGAQGAVGQAQTGGNQAVWSQAMGGTRDVMGSNILGGGAGGAMRDVMGASTMAPGVGGTFRDVMGGNTMAGGVGGTFKDLMGFNSLGGVPGQTLRQAAQGDDYSNKLNDARRSLAQLAERGGQNKYLDAATQNALGGAVPAAVAQFAGAGLGNSSAAMDTVGRAATDAVAPYQYDAMNQALNRQLSAAQGLGGLETGLRGQNLGAAQAMIGARQGDAGIQMQGAQNLQGARLAQNNQQMQAAQGLNQMREQGLGRQLAGAQALTGARATQQGLNLSAAGQLGDMGQAQTQQALQAAALAPQMYQAGYLPQQMAGQVGGIRDARRQAQLDERVGVYDAKANRRAQDLGDYSQLLLGLGGAGSATTAPGQQQPGMGQRLGSAALGGLGTYGALAGMGLANPFAALGGLGAGLLGLF